MSYPAGLMLHIALNLRLHGYVIGVGIGGLRVGELSFRLLNQRALFAANDSEGALE